MTSSKWPLERVLFAMAGTVILASVLLAVTVTPWFLALTAISKVETILRGSDAVSTVVPPAEGTSISEDGHTAIVQAGAAKDPNGMVDGAEALDGPLAQAAGPGGAG